MKYHTLAPNEYADKIAKFKATGHHTLVMLTTGWGCVTLMCVFVPPLWPLVMLGIALTIYFNKRWYWGKIVELDSAARRWVDLQPEDEREGYLEQNYEADRQATRNARVTPTSSI